MKNARKLQRNNGLRAAFADVDPEPIITCLEGFVNDERRQRLLEVIAARVGSVTVVMDALHDPHNGAAVIRSCDAFGVYTVHVVERTEQFTAACSVAKGAERWVDVIGHESAAEATRALDRFELVGTHPEGELCPRDLASIPRLALVMGNEHAGISEDLAAACTARVRVPMRGFVESLNLSVSAAILLAYATEGRAGDLADIERRRLYARGLTLTVPKSLRILDARNLLPAALADEPPTQ